MFIDKEAMDAAGVCTGTPKTGCYAASNNTVNLAWGSAHGFVFVYEMGHSVDWNTGEEGEHFSDGGMPGWEVQDGWEIRQPRGPVIDYIGKEAADDQYALTNPREDFAETFTWKVFNSNGRRYGNEPGSRRQNALNVALDSLP